MRSSTSPSLDTQPPFRRRVSSFRIDCVQEALHAGGLQAGLRELNQGVPHRYSGIFRLDGDLLRNTHMVDKQGLPRPDDLETVKLADSFCQIVLRDGFLRADHSGRDQRLSASPYQNVVVAYHGVPILGNSGELSGTLCHFDMIEQSLSDEEFACMQEAARLFASVLCRRG